jgi:hypothetical protein
VGRQPKGGALSGQLAEVSAARRGAAVRSYLLSAPRLVVMMWGRHVLRFGPRRPG